MIKRWLYYFYILSIVVLIAYLIMIFLYFKENRKYVTNISSFYLEQQLIETKYDKLFTVKKVLENEYTLLKNNYKLVKINEIKKEVETLTKFLETISLVSKKNIYIYLNNYFSKINLHFNLDILNNKKTVIASSNFFDIGKKFNLKCNPFENYGKCEIINNSYYYVTYIPNLKIYIVAKKKFYNPPKSYFNPIFLTLKSFPDIIYDIKKLDNKHFYIFDEFKPLNLFFGIGIDYKKLENFPKKFTKKTSEFLFNHFLKLTFLIFLIMLFYLAISTFILLKLKNISGEIEKENMYDKLTNLYNRKGLEKYYDENKTLLILDLDNFKYINDTFGHEKGDEILIKFTKLLKEYFEGDIIARWGGDEFIVLTNKTKEKVKRIIEKLNSEMEQMQKSFDKNIVKLLSVSCGGSVSVKPKEEKFKEADLALYKVKKTTKKGCKVYDELDYVKIEDI
jgi:diguanylate cyclase (GGDEF)-like protein